MIVVAFTPTLITPRAVLTASGLFGVRSSISSNGSTRQSMLSSALSNAYACSSVASTSSSCIAFKAEISASTPPLKAMGMSITAHRPTAVMTRTHLDSLATVSEPLLMILAEPAANWSSACRAVEVVPVFCCSAEGAETAATVSAMRDRFSDIPSSSSATTLAAASMSPTVADSTSRSMEKVPLAKVRNKSRMAVIMPITLSTSATPFSKRAGA